MRLGVALPAARPRSLRAAPAHLNDALWAQAEQLNSMRVHDVSRPGLDLAGDRIDPAVLDLGAPSAALADDVVMVGRLADDVGVFAVREVQTLDEPELLEQLQCAEDGRAPDAEASSFCLTDKLERSEVVPALGDHLGHDAARLRDVVAGLVQGVGERERITHSQNDTKSRINGGLSLPAVCTLERVSGGATAS